MSKMALIKNRIKARKGLVKQDVLRGILELSVVIPNDSLPSLQLGCGDLFRKKDKYILVISCDCDCINHAKRPSESSANVVVCDETGPYVLQQNQDTRSPVAVLNGSRVTTKTFENSKKIFTVKYGFAQPRDRAYLFPVDGGRCLSFQFGSLGMRTVTEIENEGFKRIGRVCAPYITDIRQRNAQWLQREGFPKIPKEAVRG